VRELKRKLLLISLILVFLFSLSSISTIMIKSSKAQGTHNVAVTSVTPSETLVKCGDLVNITVVVEDQGAETETFNTTVYRDSVPIEINRTTTDLAAGQNRTLIFTWNTSDTINEIYALASKEKTYDITAEATLASDTDQSDNTLVSSSTVKGISQYIAISPERTLDETLTTGKNYTISVSTDYNGTDVWGWNIRLTYRPSVLECIEVRNGDLITKTKDPSAEFNSAIDNTIGEVSAGAYFYYLYPSVPPTTNGPGTLIDITFRVVGIGNSNITLVKQDTYVQVFDQSVSPDPYDIINAYLPSLIHIFAGYFSNAIAKLVDVAITSVSPSSTSVTIGETVNVTVVVENKGEINETFDVKTYYDYAPAFPGQNVIGTQTVQNLVAGTNRTIVFAWNTTYVKEGNFIITALISGISDDAAPANNRLDSSLSVSVKLKELRPLPITEIAIGAVVVIAVIAVVYFVLRRRRKKAPVEYA